MALRFPGIGNRRKQGLKEECEGGSSDKVERLKFLEFLKGSQTAILKCSAALCWPQCGTAHQNQG